jgi:para-aminobenzoate synthetase component 1
VIEIPTGVQTRTDGNVAASSGSAAAARLRDGLWIERLPDAIARRPPVDVAESFRDLPGLCLLESARPGRRSRWTYLAADPIDLLTLDEPIADPFAGPRRALRRLSPAATTRSEGQPPFAGGLIGYLGYDLGLSFEPRRTIASDDQGLPILRLGLYDWVVAWDRLTGQAWLGGRIVDGDEDRLRSRLDGVRVRLEDGPRDPAAGARFDRAIPGARDEELLFRSSLDRAAYERGVESIRQAIADGHIYQANLTRRLETDFGGDLWPLYRHLRTGDPALFAAFLDVGPLPAGEPRAIASASPEPFLSVDASGSVESNPIKGTRPRGRDRADDRRLACELLESAKDRAENTMIVDVLRNDLGRVCRPGSVRVPRLWRLERTAAVQHLVSTVTGRLRRGRDPFDLLAAAFPGGSITGAPKLRAMEILERLEPVRRGPYTGALGWIGPDGAMATSILIRTLVGDGRRLTLHVGGGITWRSNPSEEWAETVAKAAGPLSAIGGREIDG